MTTLTHSSTTTYSATATRIGTAFLWYTWKEAKEWVYPFGFDHPLGDTGYPKHPEIYFKSSPPQDDDKAWLPIEKIWGGPHWSPKIYLASRDTPATIADVRIPWFMLGVIYVGLFFLLADRKRVRP